MQKTTGKNTANEQNGYSIEASQGQTITPIAIPMEIMSDLKKAGQKAAKKKK